MLSLVICVPILQATKRQKTEKCKKHRPESSSVSGRDREADRGKWSRDWQSNKDQHWSGDRAGQPDYSHGGDGAGGEHMRQQAERHSPCEFHRRKGCYSCQCELSGNGNSKATEERRKRRHNTYRAKPSVAENDRNTNSKEVRKRPAEEQVSSAQREGQEQPAVGSLDNTHLPNHPKSAVSCECSPWLEYIGGLISNQHGSLVEYSPVPCDLRAALATTAELRLELDSRNPTKRSFKRPNEEFLKTAKAIVNAQLKVHKLQKVFSPPCLGNGSEGNIKLTELTERLVVCRTTL